MIYRNVSYNHGTEQNILHKEEIQVTKPQRASPTFDDEIWTAISFSPDPNDNQSDFDFPFYIEPPFFERRLDSFRYNNLKGVWNC